MKGSETTEGKEPEGGHIYGESGNKIWSEIYVVKIHRYIVSPAT